MILKQHRNNEERRRKSATLKGRRAFNVSACDTCDWQSHHSHLLAYQALPNSLHNQGATNASSNSSYAGLTTVRRILKHQNPKRCLLHRFWPRLSTPPPAPPPLSGPTVRRCEECQLCGSSGEKSLEFHPLWLRQVVSTHSAQRTKQQGRALRARPLFN